MPAVITTAVGQMAVAKGRQGREAQNLVKLVINPLSESATAVGAGMAVPAAQSGVMPMAEVFKLAVSSFKVYKWSLFGSAAAA
uniref:Nuclear import protein mog1 n=1 Tax=Solanum tuberosum TaxID=4113 RepID=M1BA81_SOLTU